MAIWIPGYTRVDLGPDGGTFDEMSHPKGCLHTTEGRSIEGAESAYEDYPPHIGYDPYKRIKHQYVSLDRHSYAFRGSESDDEYVIQVEIVGFANSSHNWSDAAYKNLAVDVIRPLEELIGIPRTSLQFYGEADGIVLASPTSPVRLSSGALRNYRGWLGHQHIPNPDAHWDPGKLNIQKVFGYLAAPSKPALVEDNGMIDYIQGDSKLEDGNGIPFGYRVFRVNWLTGESVWIQNENDPGLKLWKASGKQVKVVKQDILDAFNRAVNEN